MKILAHRGFWADEEEKNTLSAFGKAFDSGFGIETDIRDRNGELVISHNPPDTSSPSFIELLELWKGYRERPLLALNVKADGLYLMLEEILQDCGMTEKDYFLFDASVPEQYIYIKRGYHIFARSSEFEERISFLDRCDGVWLDQFTDCSHIQDALPSLLDMGKTVSVISPELHGRDREPVWKLLKQYRRCDRLFLCTDLPKDAEEYFR